MNDSSAEKKLKVFFDGKCHLCASEVKIYKKNPQGETLEYIDISSPKFDAEAEGLDPNEVQKSFHIKKNNGEVISGVEAFQEIWTHLDGWNRFVGLSKIGPINMLMKFGYFFFKNLRPFLPKRKESLKL